MNHNFFRRQSSVAVAVALFLGGIVQVLPATRAHAGATTPTISAIDVATGTAAGGTQVTITGTDFTNVSEVTMGTSSTDATVNNNPISSSNYTVVSDTSITVTVPPRPCATSLSTWYFRVSTSDGGQSGPSAAYTYTRPATVFTSVTPNYGPLDGNAYSITVNGTFRCVA